MLNISNEYMEIAIATSMIVKLGIVPLFKSLVIETHGRATVILAVLSSVLLTVIACISMGYINPISIIIASILASTSSIGIDIISKIARGRQVSIT